MQLDSEERPLHGIPYRFMWDDTTGILKILIHGHDVMTINITRAIGLFCSRRGMDPTTEFAWGRTTTRLLCAGRKGKQPDGCLFPSPGCNERARLGPPWSSKQAPRHHFPGSAKRQDGGCATRKKKSGSSSFWEYIARYER
ncbi:hypothetical protein GB937_006698 [Aspergillus fischeri]|nr:hypothetical protein GB937_006698 [Aspergillus fischeri]